MSVLPHKLIKYTWENTIQHVAEITYIILYHEQWIIIVPKTLDQCIEILEIGNDVF